MQTDADPVTDRARVERVNRKLAHKGERLRRGRDHHAHVDCYLVIDTDIETYARELRVLYGGERFSPRDES